MTLLKWSWVTHVPRLLKVSSVKSANPDQSVSQSVSQSVTHITSWASGDAKNMLGTVSDSLKAKLSEGPLTASCCPWMKWSRSSWIAERQSWKSYLLKCTSYKGALLLQQASPAGAEAVLSLGLPIHAGFWKRVRTEESWSEDCRAPVLNN